MFKTKDEKRVRDNNCRPGFLVSKLELGQIIRYTPKETEFATTTGSREPKPKPRPCVIIAFSKENQPIIAPITSAKVTYGRLLKHRKMTSGPWLPVHYSCGTIAVPEDTGCSGRSPAVINHLSKHGVDGCDILAAYIWCNGERPQEKIPLLEERNSRFVPAKVPLDKDRQMSADAIQNMRAQFR